MSAFGGAGAMATAGNTNVTPLPIPFPAGITAGQLLLLAFRINSVTPGAGPDNSFVKLKTSGGVLCELWGKIALGTETGNCLYTGGASPAAHGQICRFTGAFPAIGSILDDSNTSNGGSASTSIAHGPCNVSQANDIAIVVGGCSGNVVVSYNNTTNGGAFTQIGRGNSAGLDALCWNYRIQTTPANIVSDTFTFASASGRSALVGTLFTGSVAANAPPRAPRRTFVPAYFSRS